jgi:predicted cupin superfamily sugar epimerase
LCFDATHSQASTLALGRFSASSAAPIHVVPAGVWQAARPLGEYALMGCYVGPGFDFSDFRIALIVTFAVNTIAYAVPVFAAFMNYCKN